MSGLLRIKELEAQIDRKNERINELESEIEIIKKDKDRIDWLADINNKIGNVTLPSECVKNNLDVGLRGAIDSAMIINATNYRYRPLLGLTCN